MFTLSPPFWGGAGGDPSIALVKALIHFNDALNTSIPAVAVGSPTLSNTGAAGNKVTTTGPQFGAGAFASTSADNTGLSVSSTNDLTTPYTIEFFFKPTAFGGFGRFFAATGNASANLFALSCAGGNLFYVDDTGSNQATTGVMSLGVWYYVAICYTNPNVRIYLNGTLVFTSSTFAKSMSGDTINLGLGSRSVGMNGSDAQGVLDEFRWTHGVDRSAAGTAPMATPTAEFPES